MGIRSVVPVSVIIPTYNRQDFVKEAVASVLRQNEVKPQEVIVVDDGSTDDTEKALKDFGKEIIYFFQNNRGVSSARNVGICLAKGEWIAFLDSDDLWLPGKLREHWRFVQENSGILISQTEEIWVRRGVRVNPKKYHEKPEGMCLDRLVERCLISPSAVMIHSSVFERVGLFDETMPACEDYDLWLRIGCRYPIGLVRKHLIVKRGGHSDQLSSKIEALDKYRIYALKKLLTREELNNRYRQIVCEELRRKCLIFATGCIKRGKFEEARNYLSLPEKLCLETVKAFKSAVVKSPFLKTAK